MAIDRQESPYRRGNRFDRLPIPMVTEHCIPVDAGAVQLVVESRRLTNAIARISRIRLELKLISLTRSMISRAVIGIVSRRRGLICTMITSGDSQR